MTPLTILPKFLWKHIIAYLAYADILKLATVANQFDAMTDWKALFLDGRSDAIVVVKCTSYHMTNFWKYASYNHNSCDSIAELLQFIVDDTSDSFIYYKVFIKSGEYLFANSDYINYIHSKNPCSVKITGSKTATTSFIYNSHCNDESDTDTETEYNRNAIPIIISNYFSMSYIIFYNLQCLFEKYDFYTKCFPDNTELCISNCSFNGDYSELSVDAINKTSITNCQFNSRYGINICNTASKTKNKKKLQKCNSVEGIECLISNSTFTVQRECVTCNSMANAVIQFTNNCVTKSTSVFAHFSDIRSSITINNNSINNSCYCLLLCRSIIVINDNHFANVIELQDGETDYITMNNGNRFENCGEWFMSDDLVNKSLN